MRQYPTQQSAGRGAHRRAGARGRRPCIERPNCHRSRKLGGHTARHPAYEMHALLQTSATDLLDDARRHSGATTGSIDAGADRAALADVDDPALRRQVLAAVRGGRAKPTATRRRRIGCARQGRRAVGPAPHMLDAPAPRKPPTQNWHTKATCGHRAAPAGAATPSSVQDPAGPIQISSPAKPHGSPQFTPRCRCARQGRLGLAGLRRHRRCTARLRPGSAAQGRSGDRRQGEPAPVVRLHHGGAVLRRLGVVVPRRAQWHRRI